MRRLLLQSMTKATTMIKEDAKAIRSGSFKNRTGTLRRSIVARTHSAERGTVSTDVPYSTHVEFGTKPHTIYPRNKRFLAFKAASGKMVFARKVNHPGSRPYPYMRPAMENNQRQILEEYEKVAQIVISNMAK